MAVTYSIDGGADAAKFNINATTGVITFKTAPDFENPGDADRNNIYEVTVKATDPGGAATTQALRVTVTDVVENNNLPPQFTSAGAVSVAENTTSVITVVAVDPDDGGTTPPPSGTSDIPLTWNDPRFNATVLSSGTTLNGGQNLSNKSYSEQSGDATIVCFGNNVLDTVRVKSRESVRIAAAGSFTYQNCYLEAQGAGADHADVIQTYSPGSKGTITLRNTHIRAYNQAATAGLFVADNWTGTIDLKDVIFQGGPYGLRIHPDTGGDNTIDMENVYFVGPFGAAPFLLSNAGGHRNIFRKWINVCNATIVNGVLVPGTQLAKP